MERTQDICFLRIFKFLCIQIQKEVVYLKDLTSQDIRVWRQECDNSELEGVSSRVLYALQKSFRNNDLEISLLDLDCNVLSFAL